MTRGSRQGHVGCGILRHAGMPSTTTIKSPRLGVEALEKGSVAPVLAQTTMTHSLPPEILDIVVDHLHDEPAALRACCLVSKSWVPRSRIHLFAHVTFNTHRFRVESWMKAFPDPSSSPAHHTRTLTIHGRQLITAAGAGVGRWIRAFHNVVHLHAGTRGLGDDQVSLVPFHGLSAAIKSLRLESTHARPSEVFGLICSFPILEDFALLVFGYGDETDRWTAPPASPRLTGSLELRSVIGGIGPITRRLLNLPNGPNFTKIVLACVDETDFESTTDLVSGCSGTLESLDVSDYLPGVFPSVPAPDRYLTATLSPVHGDVV